MNRVALQDVVGHNSGVSLKLTLEMNETAEATENAAQTLFAHFREWKRTHDVKYVCASFFEPQGA